MAGKALNLVACLGKAIVRNAGRPFGVDIAGNILSDAWDNWDKNKKLKEKLAELQEYAQKRVEEFLATIKTSLDEAQAAAEKPEEKLSASDRAAYEMWLAQIPARIQKAWQRPSDPDGKTVPGGTVLNSPADLEFILPPTLPKFKPGDRPISNYELVKPLGSGGFSEVWLAKEVNLGSAVAIKFGFSAEEIRTRYGPMVKADARPLHHETAVLRKLASAGVRDGILQPLFTVLDQQPECLVYEYIPDGDLNGVLHDLHNTGKPQEAINAAAHKLILTLATYLSRAHDAGIVHRDLKPANILFKRGASGELLPVIADFGIGGIAAQELLRAGRTTLGGARYQTTLMRGSHTPIYASPQQIAMQDPTPADDVHALGVIWYQLLTGDKLTMALSVPHDWMSELQAKGVHQDFISLVGKCLATKAEKRIPSAGALARELQQAFDANDAKLIAQRRRDEAARVAEAAEQKRQDAARAEELRAASEREATRRKARRWWQTRLALSVGAGLLALGVLVTAGYWTGYGLGSWHWGYNGVVVLTIMFGALLISCCAAVIAASETNQDSKDQIGAGGCAVGALWAAGCCVVAGIYQSDWALAFGTNEGARTGGRLGIIVGGALGLIAAIAAAGGVWSSLSRYRRA